MSDVTSIIYQRVVNKIPFFRIKHVFDELFKVIFLHKKFSSQKYAVNSGHMAFQVKRFAAYFEAKLTLKTLKSFDVNEASELQTNVQ